MTGYWIGYVAVVLLLMVIKAVIEDGARDAALAWVLCATCLLVMIVLFACRRCT